MKPLFKAVTASEIAKHWKKQFDSDFGECWDAAADSEIRMGGEFDITRIRHIPVGDFFYIVQVTPDEINVYIQEHEYDWDKLVRQKRRSDTLLFAEESGLAVSKDWKNHLTADRECCIPCTDRTGEFYFIQFIGNNPPRII